MRRSPFFAAAFALFAIAPSFARAAEPVDKDAASMLPQEVRARGFVTMASAGINIPHSYVDEKDNKTVIGIEPELVREAARRLGLDLKIEVTAFNGIVAGLQSGRFDLAASSLADSVDRERSMDFMDYLVTTYVLLVQAGNPKNITALDQLCGQPVAVLDASRPLELLQEQSRKCVDGGKPAINLNIFSGGGLSVAALQSGRAVANVISGPRGKVTEEQTGGKIVVLKGLVLAQEPLGWAFPKGSALPPAFKKVFDGMREEGFYARVLAKYKLEDAAISRPAEINGAGRGVTTY